MSAKGNLARGRQKTLVSGENIKTIYGKSILGSGDLDGTWNLLKSFEVEEGQSLSEVVLDLGAGFFVNPKCNGYKIEMKLKTKDTFTATGIPIRTYFKAGSSLGYRLVASSGQTVFRPSATADFEAEIMVERMPENITITKIMPSNSASNTANPIYATRNNGNFENGATPETLRYLLLDAMATSGFTMEEGSTIKFYEREE